MSAKKVQLSLKQKLQICAEIKEISKDEICKKYCCSRSTVNRIIQNEKVLLEKCKTSNVRSKRDRKSKYPRIEQAVYLWFNQMWQSGAIVPGTMVIAKAN